MKNLKIEVGDHVITKHVVWTVDDILTKYIQMSVVQTLSVQGAEVGTWEFFDFDDIQWSVDSGRFELVKNKSREAHRLYEKLDS